MTNQNPAGISVTSLSLIDRLRNNDEEAWNLFVKLYRDYIQSFLRRHQVKPGDVDDITQDILITLARKVAEFHPQGQKGTFRGWLKLIIRSRTIDFYRRNRHATPAEGGSQAQRFLLDFPEMEAEDDHHPEEQQAVQRLYRRAIDLVSLEFEQRTWTMFYRVVVDGVPATEVARELDVSAASVRMAKSRVLRRLREVLDEPVR